MKKGSILAIERVKENYDFTDWDEKILIKIASLMEAYVDDFVNVFYNKAMRFKNPSNI